MSKYKISKKAKIDLQNIWNYTLENWSVTQANNYLNLIIEELKRLAKDNSQGRNYSNIREGYLGSNIKSHIIFYKIVSKNEIEIIRILHQKMDLKRRLGI